MSQPSKSPRRGIQPKADIGHTNIPGDPPPIRLPISALTVDFEIQQRAGMNPDLLEEYAGSITTWIDEAPIEVFADAEQTRWVADGFHRVEAARRAGLDAISARQRPGTRRDALLFAVGANQRHGLRRTQADKRRAVETLLLDPEWCQWSDRMIAEKAGVDHKTVAAIRRESIRWGNSPPGSTPPAGGDPAPSAGNDPATKRRGRDGKAYSVPPPKPDREPIVEPLEGDDLDGIRQTTAKIQALHGSTARPDPAPATAPPKTPTPKEAMHAAHSVTAALGLLRKVEDALLEEDARVLVDELRKALDRLSARSPEGGDSRPDMEAEIERRVKEQMDEVLRLYGPEFDRYREFNDAYRGAFTEDEYRLLLSALHPDRCPPERAPQFAKAFQLVKGKERVLCKPTPPKQAETLPQSLAELLARRKPTRGAAPDGGRGDA